MYASKLCLLKTSLTGFLSASIVRWQWLTFSMAEADAQYCVLTTRGREWIAKRANDASAPCGGLTGAQVRWAPHMHLSVNYMKQRCSSKQHQPPLVCGERLIPALMYKHTTHNTSSARWCHSVIPGLRLTSPPNLIAVIMAWRWNKSFFGGWALHDCSAVAGYKGPPHKRFLPGTSCHSHLGCGFKRFHRKSGICHGKQSNWCLNSFQKWGMV